jgi:predicted amidohydrolase
MLHSLREPKATGAEKSLTPAEIGPQFLWNGKEAIPHPNPGGHISMGGDGFSVDSGSPAKPGGGWLAVKTLWPPADDCERKRIGGKGHDFEVADTQYGLAEEGYQLADAAYAVRSTIGLLGWRVELRPKTPTASVEFLHVLQVGVNGQTPEAVRGAACQTTPESHIVTLQQAEKRFILKLNRTGPRAGAIAVQRPSLDEALPETVEDHWRHFQNDPNFKAWTTDPRYRVVIEPSLPYSTSRTVRVAGVVLKWLRGDKDANYRRLEPLIREAAAHGAQIVCTTECFLDGSAIADKTIPLDQYRALGEPIPQGEYFRKLAGLAKELKILLIAGMLEADGERRFNTAVIIGPQGDLIGKYHKQQLEHEAVRNTAGHESSVFETPFGKLGVMICADRRFPDVVKGFCERGADFLICPSGGMFGPKSNDHILQARAKENRKFIVFVHPAEFLVTGPDGTILDQTILGNQLLISPDQIGTEADSQRVFYFDVPLTPRP